MDNVPSLEEMQQQQAQAQAQEEMRLSILDQILETDAKDRLVRLAIVKKDKARQIEDGLINAAKSGQLKQKVTEQQLIQMLETTTKQENKKITFSRKNRFDDDDDDDSDVM